MPRRLASVLAVLVVLTAACSSNPDVTPSEEVPAAAAGCPDGLVESIDAWGDAGFDGVVAIVGAQDSCVTAAGMRDPGIGDPMPDDAVFAIGSVSKSFTAAAVLQLAADHALSLDDTAGALVAGLSGPAADATLAQLLVHTSGLQGGVGADHQPLSRESAIAAISRLPRAFPPGTDFGYTNAGYTLLALVVDAATGDYRSYLADQVLARHGAGGSAGFWDGVPAAAGPRAVGYLDAGRSGVLGDFPGPHWATSGNGDLALSMPRLAAWTADLFRGDVIPTGSVAEMEEPRWDNGDGTSETYGWVRFSADALGAAGFASAGGGGDTGHNAIVAYLPDSDTAIAIASSTPDVTAEQLMEVLVPALLSEDPMPPPAGAELAPPDPETVELVTGTYVVGNDARLVVTGQDDVVEIEAVGEAAVDALFSIPAGVTAGDVEAHEAGVVGLLTGEGEAGEDERRAVGEMVGSLHDVRLRGTIVDHHELRTYVTLVGADASVEAWYALDDQDGVAAAEAPTEPPALQFDQQRGATLISSDPTGRRPAVRVTVGDNRLTLDNGTGAVIAHRAG